MTASKRSHPTLAQRLGYGAKERLLIINCDDLGSSHSANVATMRSMTDGVATSATLMAPCPWAPEAAALFKGRPVGVHLTLTAEYPGYRWRGLTRGASLHDQAGFLPRTTAEALRRLDPQDARVECRAQIEAAYGWGVDVTHLDAHMMVMQSSAELFAVYLDLAAEFRLPVRMLAPARTDEQGFQARQRADARGVLYNDAMIEPWPQRTRDVLFECAPTLAPGVTEINAHPVLAGAELSAYDDENAAIRIHDADCLMDRDVRDVLEKYSVKRISFRDIRTLQRADL